VHQAIQAITEIQMNRLNPDKLLMSKWTAAQPENRERHFIVTRLIRAEDETIIGCVLEAVINKNSCEIDWRELQDSTRWLTGWK
jgi:tryptophan-rich hypothetical protein